MQNSRSAAATISMVNLMARSFPLVIATSCFALWPNYTTRAARARPVNRPGPCIKFMHALHNETRRGFRTEHNARIIARDQMSRISDLPDQSFQGNFPALGQPIDELALAEIKGAILAKLRLAIGKDTGMATRHDWYKGGGAGAARRIVHHWLTTEKLSYDAGAKRVYYLSLEISDRPPVHRLR